MACVIETSIIRLRQCYIYKLLFDFKEPVLYISISNKRECFRYKSGCGKHISKYLKKGWLGLQIRKIHFVGAKLLKYLASYTIKELKKNHIRIYNNIVCIVM